MLSHPRGPLTGINYYVGPAKSATSHEKLKDQLEKNIAYFSEFSPQFRQFPRFSLSLSVFWQVVWVARVECFFLLPLPLFLLLLWPVVLVFGNIFILFGRYIVLVDFHVHGEQQMLRKKKKSLLCSGFFAEQR